MKGCVLNFWISQYIGWWERCTDTSCSSWIFVRIWKKCRVRSFSWTKLVILQIGITQAPRWLEMSLDVTRSSRFTTNKTLHCFVWMSITQTWLLSMMACVVLGRQRSSDSLWRSTILRINLAAQDCHTVTSIGNPSCGERKEREGEWKREGEYVVRLKYSINLYSIKFFSWKKIWWNNRWFALTCYLLEWLQPKRMHQHVQRCQIQDQRQVEVLQSAHARLFCTLVQVQN